MLLGLGDQAADLIGECFQLDHGCVNVSQPLLANDLVAADATFRSLCPNGDVWSVPASHPESHRVRPSRDKAVNAAKGLAKLLGTRLPATFGDEAYERMLSFARPIVEQYPKLSSAYFDLIREFLNCHHKAEVNRTRIELPQIEDGVYVDLEGAYEERAVAAAVEFRQAFITKHHDARERTFPPFGYDSELYLDAVDAALRIARAWRLTTDATLGPSAPLMLD